MLGRGQYWPIQPSLNHGVPAEITEPATTLAGLQRYVNSVNANASRSAIDGGFWRRASDEAAPRSLARVDRSHR